MMKLDRTKLVIEDLHGRSASFDRKFWKDRTPMERLRAVQIDRHFAKINII